MNCSKCGDDLYELGRGDKQELYCANCKKSTKVLETRDGQEKLLRDAIGQLEKFDKRRRSENTE